MSQPAHLNVKPEQKHFLFLIHVSVLLKAKYRLNYEKFNKIEEFLPRQNNSEAIRYKFRTSDTEPLYLPDL